MKETDNMNDGIYRFRGREFPSNKKTIDILNFALALNGKSDRYVKIKDIKK